jgi:uncharacterized iron-regulated membrane protein
LTIKQFIRKIHLWLGLITGPIVFVIALTGCIYAFQEEIQDFSQSYRFVEVSQSEMLPPSRIRAIADSIQPGKHLHAIMYHTKDRAVKAIYYAYDQYYNFVYINPYSGKVLETHDVENSFFGFILEGHFYLWLPKTIGQVVVSTATLIFFFIVLSGIYLWWPRNKHNKKQKFTIKRNVSWRRRNFDLHSVLGAYISLLAIILIITGLVWGFTWFRNGVYSLASGGETYQEYSEPSSLKKDSIHSSVNPLDHVFEFMRKEYPKAEWIELHVPELRTSPVAVNVNTDSKTYWKTDYRYFDQYSFKELSVNHQWGRFENASGADLLMRMNYDIHVGGIFGFAGKIFAFLISLVIASLPITGFLMWYGKIKKTKKKSESNNP